MRAADFARRAQRRGQAGATLVEFGLVVLLFFTFLFIVIELARLMFLFNTLQEVTRRAANGAAVSELGNGSAMDKVRRHAIFRADAGSLMLMRELTDQAVRIDYLSLSRDAGGSYAMQEVGAGALPASPAENRHNCALDPYAANCIRLVRARICDPRTSTSCAPMQFTPMVSVLSFRVPLPLATTIVRAQSFGAP